MSALGYHSMISLITAVDPKLDSSWEEDDRNNEKKKKDFFKSGVIIEGGA